MCVISVGTAPGLSVGSGVSVGNGTSVTEDKLIAVGKEVGSAGAQAVKMRPLKTKHMPSVQSGLCDNRKRWSAAKATSTVVILNRVGGGE